MTTETTTATVTPDATLGGLVTRHPSLARPLQHLGLDYCCGGDEPLASAVDRLGLDLDAVVAELAEVAAAAPTEPPAWVGLDAAGLVDHIEGTHHRYLRDELPRVDALLDKIVTVHGDRHPELASIHTTFRELRADLEPHLRKEELMLFPAIRALAADGPTPAFPFGSVRNPISVMLVEHDRAGELLQALRDRTDSYRPPADGCATYQAAFEGLAEIEADTHLHVHKENNVLFPMVVALEAQVDARGAERVGTTEAACPSLGHLDPSTCGQHSIP